MSSVAVTKGNAEGKPYDGNMRCAVAVGMALLAWYAKVHGAKVLDSRRPVKVRQQASLARQQMLWEVIRLWLDRSDYGKLFKGQPFNDPWLPGAKGGKFV